MGLKHLPASPNSLDCKSLTIMGLIFKFRQLQPSALFQVRLYPWGIETDQHMRILRDVCQYAISCFYESDYNESIS